MNDILKIQIDIQTAENELVEKFGDHKMENELVEKYKIS